MKKRQHFPVRRPKPVEDPLTAALMEFVSGRDRLCDPATGARIVLTEENIDTVKERIVTTLLTAHPDETTREDAEASTEIILSAVLAGQIRRGETPLPPEEKVRVVTEVRDLLAVPGYDPEEVKEALTEVFGEIIQ